ncbi:MAG: alpha/beta hydrolase, partial [Candidatus Afipia apatlaquensis]|nr:alpha/beta hydrolase [Candidatus Afipia apatlaquensis]
CYCPVDVTIIPGAGHSPHRETPEPALKAAADFANRLLSLHGEGAVGQAA